MLTLLLALAQAAEDPRAVAERWAPVIFQDLADGLGDDAALRRWDLITAVDFDGNLDPFDDVEHSAATPLPGAVYYDVVETETHLFVVYSLFHPVDWNPFGGVDHENDMEHLWLVVRKHHDGTEELQVLHAQAHGQLFGWSNGAVRGGRFKLAAGGFALENGHPKIYVEPQGHGPASCRFPGGLPYTNAIDCSPDADEDMVIYRVAPGADWHDLPEPDVSDARPVQAPYALVSARDVLWPHRRALAADHADPPLWDEPFVFAPGRNKDLDPTNDVRLQPGVLRLGGDFAGDEGDGGGVPPWGYQAKDAVLLGTTFGARGELLLDPAHLFDVLYADPCTAEPAFWNYLSNPYLDDLLVPGSAVPWDGVDHGRRCDSPPPDTDVAADDTDAPDADDSDGGVAWPDGGTDAPDTDTPWTQGPPPDDAEAHCGCATGPGGRLGGLGGATLALLALVRRRRP